MKYFLLLLILAFELTQIAFAQVDFLNQPYDLGLVDNSNNYIDIPIKNTSDKKVFIFRTDADKRFKINYSSKTILPDSTVYMRVHFKPLKKGAFTENIKIHFSCFENPVSIRIKGYVQEIPNNSIACPNFNQSAPQEATHFIFAVKVIDKETRNPIESASIKLIKNGLIKEELITNKNGDSRKKIDLGLYYFVTSHNEYNTVEFPKYINKNNNHLIVEMERNEDMIVQEQPATPINEEDTEIITIETSSPEEETPQKDSSYTPAPPADEKYPDFPLSKYKPNNIVFLIDVSTSMRYTGKLDLLKASMIEMTKLLRDVDYITIVTYASKTQVAMETMTADNKDSIIHSIEALQARGMTAGGRGLKLAYSKACEAYINGGNNEIIMATDGDFNTGNENVYKLAKKYQAKGIKVSVIGIKNRREHERNMRKLAQMGAGNYIKIDNFDDALQKLVKEIKMNSSI